MMVRTDVNQGRFNERVWHITIAKCVAVLGFVLACTTMNTGARYFAMCAFATGVYAVNSVILGWVSTTCGQTREKKAVSLAIVNMFASISGIYSPVSSLTLPPCVLFLGSYIAAH